MRLSPSKIAAFFLTLCMAGASFAAPPDVPAQLSYQGVLLDDLGNPRSGPVDLTVRIYDMAAGGALLYKQAFVNTLLSAGTFSIVIGTTGDATDVPTNPLTTSLTDVFTGDLIASPGRFLELAVGGDPALARVQVLSSPLALRAESAAHADTADSATSADTVVSVAGTDPEVLTQIFTHFDFDGSDPPNTDPSEGIADPDGDGIANFMDGDNDGDGLSDGAEIGQGSDINLITPTVFGSNVEAAQGGTAFITGTNFEAGMTVLYDGLPVAVSNLTSTSFDFPVPPSALGTVPVVATRLNGQSDTGFVAFVYTPANQIGHFSGIRVSSYDVKRIRTVVVGENADDYRVDTNDSTNPNLAVAVDGAGEADVAWNPAGDLEGLKCVASGSSCRVELSRDSDADFILDQDLTVETVTSTTASSLQSADIAFESDGTAVMTYVRDHDGTSADVVVARDQNGNDDWTDPGDVIELETGATHGSVRVTVDSAGRAAVLYSLDDGAPGSLKLAYDLSNDGDFGDANELQTVFAGDVGCLDVAVDGNDRLAILYSSSAGGGLTLIQDLDGDADLGDAGETSTLGTSPATSCMLDRMASGGIAEVDNGNGGAVLRADRNFDDVIDPAELPVQTNSSSQVGLGVGTGDEILVITDSHFYLGL